MTVIPDRVVIIIGQLTPPYGAARVAIDLAIGMRSYAKTVELVTCDGGQLANRRHVPDGVVHVHLNRAPGVIGWTSFAVRLRKHITNTGQTRDTALIPLLSTMNIATVASAILNKRVVAIVPTEHNLQSQALQNYGAKAKVIRALIPIVYRFATKIVCVSEAVADDLVEKLRLQPEKIVVIYNPVDADRLKRLAKQPASESGHPLPLPPNSIACVAELKPAKQQEILIRALAQTRRSDINLVLIGDGRTRSELESLALRLNVADRVLFLGRQENPWPIVVQCCASVLVPRFEGFGLALAESAVVGVRPMGLSIGGLRELLPQLGAKVISSTLPEVEAVSQAFLEVVEQDCDYQIPAEWIQKRTPVNVAGEYRDLFNT